MQHKQLMKAGAALAASATVLAALATGVAGASAPKVTVRIEGKTKTLLPARTVQTKQGWVTKDGVAKGKCSATSAQGALNDATHGNWRGTWSKAYDEYFVTTVMGQKATGSQWWELFRNGRSASVGACDLKPKPGDKLLLALVSGNGENAISASAPARVTRGHSFAVTVGYLDSKGKHHKLAGASVSLNGHTVKTNASGVAHVKLNTVGRKTLHIAKSGYVRDEATVRVRS